MAKGLSLSFTRQRPCVLPASSHHFSYIRLQSTASPQWPLRPTAASDGLSAFSTPARLNDSLAPVSGLARLPTSSILRSLFLGLFFTSPLLFRPGLAVFQTIANSQSLLLNPDKNPILRAAIRPIVYDQFCAGRNAAEIHKTSQGIKDLGFSGVVLCYGKEVVLDKESKAAGAEGKDAAMNAEIIQWRDGNLETLEMMGEGDWLGIKMTGAGVNVTNILASGSKVPSSFTEAMNAICDRAASRGARVYIDSEQQITQHAIDQCTYDLMRRYNRGEQAVVYNTIQAYLKASRQKVQHQLQLASDEGWRSGIKLVRGAYIAYDKRELIHDTKADTDKSYNGIVEDLLRGDNFPVFSKNPELKHDILLAGHNTETIRNAARLATDLAATSKLKVVPDFAQLQGMADDIGCELIQIGEDAQKNVAATSVPFVPRVYKCLTWGTIQECMQYLTRRLIENRGAADRMREGSALLRKELWRRLFRLN